MTSPSHAVLQHLHHDQEDLELLKIAKEEQCVIYDASDNGFHGFGNDWWINENCPYSYKNISIDSMYPEKYFGKETGHPNEHMASEIYRYMQQIYQKLFGRHFRSVLELGTGGGEITREFSKDALDYIAVEGTVSGVEHLIGAGIEETRIIHQNLKFLDGIDRKFDIAMCTEVAEHIEPFFASKIVDNCIRHAEVVWFSAANRNRPAHYHHINEQRIEVWDNLFANMGHNFLVPLNGLWGRASRLYLSERMGAYLQLSSASRGCFRGI